MKKGIECSFDELISGCPHLVITKEKGALSRDEIEDAAREYWPGEYLLIVDAGAGGMFQRIGAGIMGDTAHLLDATHVFAALGELRRLHSGKEEP